jgi:hypothetical protein
MAAAVSAAGFAAGPGLAIWDRWMGGQGTAGNSRRQDDGYRMG